MKRILSLCMAALILLFHVPVSAAENEENQTGLVLTAESALLMEATTGKVIYEKNADVKKAPASVTKIMTLLLAFESLAEGKIKLQDSVTVSEHAASMGGSQVFLEPDEIQTVDTMIKCIAVSSANDASVALGEHISGSETAFVEKMNEKAKELGMENTNFVNCCGLDTEGHMTTARDIAIMSKELTTKYPDIFQYSSIWMDEFTHKTSKGESVFGLSSTNKLLKTYNGCNGLKTGSTSKAKFCISATAQRNKVPLIAVVMACPDSRSRSRDITKLFDYGFSNVTIYEDEDPLDGMTEIEVYGGEKKTVKLKTPDPFSCALLKEEMQGNVEKRIHLLEHLEAPFMENEVIGEIEYEMNGEIIGVVPVKTAEELKKMSISFAIGRLWQKYLNFSVREV